MLKPGKSYIRLLLVAALSACSTLKSFSVPDQVPEPSSVAEKLDVKGERTTIWDALRYKGTEQPVMVNRFIWQASLDVLNFLPIESVDPFSGLIVTGFGKPPGGKVEYRATIHVTDPALEARALKLSLHSRNGTAAIDIIKGVEDAILLRARQLYSQEARF